MSTQTARVTFYRTTSCPYCVAAAQLLESVGATFDTVLLDDHPDRAAVTSAILPGHTTVPLVVIDDRPIGGYRELAELHAGDGLRPLLFGGAT